MNITEDDSKVKKTKKEIQNIDGFLALIFANPLLKKELEMFFKLLKISGTKEVKAIIDVYPCDDDMTKRPNRILFQWSRDIVIGEKNHTELK